MKVRSSIGRSDLLISILIGGTGLLTFLLWATSALAQPPVAPPATAAVLVLSAQSDQPHDAMQPGDMLEIVAGAWQPAAPDAGPTAPLDEQIFTDLSPIVDSPNAVRLPTDQQPE